MLQVVLLALVDVDRFRMDSGERRREIDFADLRPHFGLGAADKMDTVEISWPSGAKQSFKNIEGDKFWLIVEGNADLAPQPIRPK